MHGIYVIIITLLYNKYYKIFSNTIHFSQIHENIGSYYGITAIYMQLYIYYKEKQPTCLFVWLENRIDSWQLLPQASI